MQHKDWGLAVHLGLRRLFLVMVVVLVVVSVLELIFLVVRGIWGVVGEVSGCGLQLLERPSIVLIDTLVMLAPLVLVTGVILVGTLGLHLSWVASAARLVMVIIVISTYVAARVLLFEISVVLRLAVLGEIALVI